MIETTKRSNRGRPRKAAPNGIDLRQVPNGIWFDARDQVWFIREDGKRKRVAGSDARLSDLHRIAEEMTGVNRGTLSWALGEFHVGRQFRALSKRTQDDYEYQQSVATAYPSRLGGKLGEARLSAITRPGIQRMIDKIAEQYPSKAAHLLRYLRVAFRWLLNYGLAPATWQKINPADGIKAPTEAAVRVVPTPEQHVGVLAQLRLSASRKRVRGGVAPYLWAVIEIAYLCRLRPIEVVTLTDAHVTADGLCTNRRKGSRDTLVQWSPRLRAAVDAALALRALAWRKRAIPLRPEDRPLIVSERGDQLNRSSLSSAWERSKKITGAKFGLHAMKHRGITDTEGTRGDKQRASGHKSERMLDVYDHEIPAVTTPKGA